jgi:hypothetical protein
MVFRMAMKPGLTAEDRVHLVLRVMMVFKIREKPVSIAEDHVLLVRHAKTEYRMAMKKVSIVEAAVRILVVVGRCCLDTFLNQAGMDGLMAAPMRHAILAADHGKGIGQSIFRTIVASHQR